MDLTPFNYINPCGYSKLRMTQVNNIVSNIDLFTISKFLIQEFLYILNISNIKYYNYL
ncbi:MAG: hypothetical protein N4P96_00315 [Candidatus Lightella neohaematopini]|nr:hypothetical protein [Candidatus Lightella neohaematopini]